MAEGRGKRRGVGVAEGRGKRRGTDRRRGERGGGTEWLYGLHPVREALRAGRREIHRVWIREGTDRAELAEVADAAGAAGVVVERVPRSVLDERVAPDAQSQGIAAEAEPLPELSLRALVERAADYAAPLPPVLLALDGVEDPQNVGAIARVAEAAGVAGLVLTERRAPALTPAVARASAGAIEWLPVARVPNLNRALGGLQERGYWVVAAAPEDGRSLYEMEDRLLDAPLVVVLGAEGRGVRPSVASAADHRVWVPMRGEVASLNVSTAGAAILFDLVRRRGQPER
ncbi:MAG: 23S rRNA (guanosine(2251)-2'-O)-methyltransferase RlmB [bacterium]|nr:23S rRNA (guanosine(2251)-2'-O)-methyltransferase RlmB [bacterium]